MRRRLPAGLRWRLLVALVVTSAVTLGVAAVVVLSRCRRTSATRAREPAQTPSLNAAPDIQRALAAKPKDRGDRGERPGFDLRYRRTPACWSGTRR